MAYEGAAQEPDETAAREERWRKAAMLMTKIPAMADDLRTMLKHDMARHLGFDLNLVMGGQPAPFAAPSPSSGAPYHIPLDAQHAGPLHIAAQGVFQAPARAAPPPSTHIEQPDFMSDVDGFDEASQDPLSRPAPSPRPLGIASWRTAKSPVSPPPQHQQQRQRQQLGADGERSRSDAPRESSRTSSASPQPSRAAVPSRKPVTRAAAASAQQPSRVARPRRDSQQSESAPPPVRSHAEMMELLDANAIRVLKAAFEDNAYPDRAAVQALRKQLRIPGPLPSNLRGCPVYRWFETQRRSAPQLHADRPPKRPVLAANPSPSKSSKKSSAGAYEETPALVGRFFNSAASKLFEAEYERNAHPARDRLAALRRRVGIADPFPSQLYQCPVYRWFKRRRHAGVKSRKRALGRNSIHEGANAAKSSSMRPSLPPPTAAAAAAAPQAIAVQTPLQPQRHRGPKIWRSSGIARRWSAQELTLLRQVYDDTPFLAADKLAELRAQLEIAVPQGAGVCSIQRWFQQRRFRDRITLRTFAGAPVRQQPTATAASALPKAPPRVTTSPPVATVYPASHERAKPQWMIAMMQETRKRIAEEDDVEDGDDTPQRPGKRVP